MWAFLLGWNKQLLLQLLYHNKSPFCQEKGLFVWTYVSSPCTSCMPLSISVSLLIRSAYTKIHATF